jgi:hypothetical protein
MPLMSPPITAAGGTVSRVPFIASAQGTEYYPDHLLPLVGELQVVDARFAELRERVLLDYGRNTARLLG